MNFDFWHSWNPRTYTQTYTKEGGGGGGEAVGCHPSPGLQDLGNILPLIDSLPCDLQDKVYM